MGDVGELLDDFEPDPDIKPRTRSSAALIRNGMKFAKKMRAQSEFNRRQPTWREQLKSYGAGKNAWKRRRGK
jgi:hypothetical protein